MNNSKKVRPLSKEKQEKAEAKRKAVREYVAKLKEMSPEELEELASRIDVRTVEGRILSPTNQILLHHQRENVTLVGGFKQWKNAGRAVRAGETGLLIWVPRERKGETPEDSEVNFYFGNVFDVTQTDEIPPAPVVSDPTTPRPANAALPAVA